MRKFSKAQKKANKVAFGDGLFPNLSMKWWEFTGIFQRAFRKYHMSDLDLAFFQYAIYKDMAKKLMAFRKYTSALPADRFDNLEDWYKTLDQMIEAFELMDPSVYHEDDEEEMISKKIREGIKLFFKYFKYLEM